MNWILLGVQGSGKGTQAKLLAEKFNMVIFEAGAQLRKLATQDNLLSKEVQEVMEQGALVRPEIINYILEQFLESTPPDQRIIFDGIPRSHEQMLEFEAILKKYNRKFTVIYIVLDRAKAIERLTKRAKIQNRQDDNPKTIAERIDIFYNVTIEVIEKLHQDAPLIEVNGDQSIEEVFKEMISKINKIEKIQK